MKLKHNKKRNTAFLYEVLVRELARTVVEKNQKLKETLASIINKNFNKETLLFQELNLYKTLYESSNVPPHLAEKLIFEVRKEHSKIDKKILFEEQTHVIKQINKVLSKSVFSNFVPNYKSIATIYQIFDQDCPVKQRVLLENEMAKKLISNKKKKENVMKPIDNIVFKSFVSRFNSEYSSKLVEEQRRMLNKYISSFMDNGIELKIYLNEEVARLKKVVKRSLELQDVKSDIEMTNKTKKILSILDEVKEKKIDKYLINKIFKIQKLAKEILD
jgi:uncharacterized protein with ATP-grasp and redox domains